MFVYRVFIIDINYNRFAYKGNGGNLYSFKVALLSASHCTIAGIIHN